MATLTMKKKLVRRRKMRKILRRTSKAHMGCRQDAILMGHRFIVEAIKKHTIDEDVGGNSHTVALLLETNVAVGYSKVPSQVGRLR